MGLLFKHGGLEAWGDEQLAPHYSAGWAWAGNAPFDWGKQVASHLGGTRNPMVVHWPGGIARRGRRSEPLHARERRRRDRPRPRRDPDARHDRRRSRSSRSTASPSPTRSPDAAAPERHTQQYYEILGNRGCTRTAGCSRSGCSGSRGTLDPETLRTFGPGWDPDDEPGRALLPARRLHAVEEPRGRASGEGARSCSELFWAEAERQQRPAAARRTDVLLRHRCRRSRRSRSSSTAATSRTSRAG